MGKCGCFFFPRDNSLISRGNSHVSRVRGLVVRCLLFNPEVSCSNPWVSANFFYKYSEAEGSDFFRHYETFRLCETFFRLCETFFRNFLNVPKESSFQFFWYFARERMLKNPKGSLFSEFSALCDLAETSKKFGKSVFLKTDLFYATFLKFVFTEAPAQFLQETKRFARGLLKALRLTGDHQKCFRKILNFFSIFCLRFSVEKEWVFCCFQLGKNGFRGLRVSLRVFFGAVKLMKF